MTILDLDVLVRPCPKDGATWRPQAIAQGGKRQFPFLVDPNTGEANEWWDRACWEDSGMVVCLARGGVAGMV